MRIVGQRFAHPHEDDVGNALLLCVQDGIECNDLLDDLKRGEISFGAVDTACTELATDGTTDLRADASGAAGSVWNQDRFSIVSVGPTQQQLLRPIRADLMVDCE